MPRRSAGILPYRFKADGAEVLLVHPGGPFWRNKDVGAWQIAKGEIEEGEAAENAARRETEEELGITFNVELKPLGELKQAGGKTVIAFAAETDLDPQFIVSNTIEIEWPRKSGRNLIIPEIDAARWLPLPDAHRLMLPSQFPFLDRLELLLLIGRQDTIGDLWPRG